MTATGIDPDPTTVMRRIGDEDGPVLTADQLPNPIPARTTGPIPGKVTVPELPVRPAAPAASELATWWRVIAESDFNEIQGKIEEYSDSDLLLMGTTLCPSGTDDATKVEAACMFYLLGKAARAVGAYQDGRRPSDDTLHDATTYSMMARRARQSGGWPN